MLLVLPPGAPAGAAFTEPEWRVGGVAALGPLRLIHAMLDTPGADASGRRRRAGRPLRPTLKESRWTSPLCAAELIPGMATVGVALAAARAGLASAAFGQTVAVALMACMFVQVALGPAAWRTDMHMAYFAALALPAGFCAPRPILLGTLTVALHHLALNFAAPILVFSSGRAA